jgi:hypothetical protein
MSKETVKITVVKQEQAVTPDTRSVEPKPAVKTAPRKTVKRRQTGDFWINLSVVLFISVCLLVLSFELLVKLAQ